MSNALSQHHPTVEGYLGVLIPATPYALSSFHTSRHMSCHMSRHREDLRVHPHPSPYSPSDQDEEELTLGADILHGGGPRANLPTEDVIEDLGHILLCLKVQTLEVGDEVERDVMVVELLSQLRCEFRLRLLALRAVQHVLHQHQDLPRLLCCLKGVWQRQET